MLGFVLFYIFSLSGLEWPSLAAMEIPWKSKLLASLKSMSPCSFLKSQIRLQWIVVFLNLTQEIFHALIVFKVK